MSSLNNKNYAFNEMIVHTSLCTHKEPKKVLVVGECDDEFKGEVAKHSVEAVYVSIDELASKDEKEFDIILVTKKDVINEMSLANIDRILKDDGVLSFLTYSYSDDDNKLKDDLKCVGEKFWIAMPYRFGHTTCILASKKYHPTADLVLQVSDLLDELNYYSSEIHMASFVFPANIHRKLTGIAKR